IRKEQGAADRWFGLRRTGQPVVHRMQVAWKSMPASRHRSRHRAGEFFLAQALMNRDAGEVPEEQRPMKTFRAIWSTIKKLNRVLRRRLMVDVERNALRFHWNAARGEWLFTLTQSSSFSTEVSNSAKPLKTNILRCWVYSQNLARVVAVKWELCKNNPACPCVHLSCAGSAFPSPRLTAGRAQPASAIGQLSVCWPLQYELWFEPSTNLAAVEPCRGNLATPGRRPLVRIGLRTKVCLRAE